MSKSDLPTQNDTDASPQIIQRPEYDKHGRYTGHEYFVCTGCGIDAMYRDVVATRCQCGGV